MRNVQGGLAQLARALAWHARGHRFDSDILHISTVKAFNDLEAFVILGHFKHASNGKVVAYGARTNKKWVAVIDGKEQKPYDNIDSLQYSPDGNSLGYLAKTGKKWFAVVNGKESNKYDEIVNKRLIFSTDGKNVVYEAILNKKVCVVFGGKEGLFYDRILSNIYFDTPNSLHYMALKENKVYLVEEVLE